VVHDGLQLARVDEHVAHEERGGGRARDVRGRR
jgi:hypothetical protein